MAPNLFTTCLVAAVATVCANSASAVEVALGTASHGPANCQTSMAVHDPHIRKRPRAIANEGTAGAYITCNFEGLPTIPHKVTDVSVRFNNVSSPTMYISCTLVDAFGSEVFSAYHVKSFMLLPRSGGGLQWQASIDNAGINYTAPALSCVLPVGVEITGTLLTRLHEVGQ